MYYVKMVCPWAHTAMILPYPPEKGEIFRSDDYNSVVDFLEAFHFQWDDLTDD